MLQLGLTGGIGSGKSTVGAMLQALGATLIDADAVSRRTTAAGGAAIAAIAKKFGADYIDEFGAMDRVKMRELVFATPAARAQLEAIVHPLVATGIADALRTCSTPCAVLDIPLLAESSRWRFQLDAVVVVDCSEETQLHRVRQRSGLNAQAVQQIIQAQASRAERLACADAVVLNDGISLDDLQAQVRLLAARFGL